jgi:iron(III) transport system ATP-binding protein
VAGTPGAEASLICRGLSVGYGPIHAVNGVDLVVRRGELMAVLGPSGSGKTTLLHAAAGFVAPAEGEIHIAGQQVSGPGWAIPPERRSIGLVFQSYALWPHMTALDTVAYPLERRGVGREQAREKARLLLERVGLGSLAARRPGELSGGEQQRVGLARALAASPALFLLDEPTANLDATIKPLLQQEIVREQRSTGAGALYVTHDPAEAFAVADRVAVLRDGRLLQVGEPVSIYSEPANEWVARLTGPGSTLAVVAGRRSDGSIELGIDGVQLACAGELRGGPGPGIALLRPEWAELASAGTLPLSGSVKDVRYQGSTTDYTLAGSAYDVIVRREGPPEYAPGAIVSWAPKRVVVLPAEGAAA